MTTRQIFYKLLPEQLAFLCMRPPDWGVLGFLSEASIACA